MQVVWPVPRRHTSARRIPKVGDPAIPRYRLSGRRYRREEIRGWLHRGGRRFKSEKERAWRDFTRRARHPASPDAAYAVSAVWAWWCLAPVGSDIHRTGLGPQLRRGVEQCCVTPRRMFARLS